MANTFLTISMITQEALRILENTLTFTKLVNREYDGSFAKAGAKIGYTLNIRKPVRYEGRLGQAAAPEAMVETSVPLTLNTQFGVDLQASMADRTLSLDDYSNRFIKPAIATIANRIDYDGLQLYKQIPGAVGTPGTVPADLQPYLSAGVLLDNNAAPVDDERYVVTTPQMQATLVNALSAVFNPQALISEQYKRGRMGMAGGFTFYMDQNTPAHTVGTYAGSPQSNGVAQVGASIITDGWSSNASSLKQGDVITFSGCYGVNPQNRQSTAALQQFVVTADVSDTTGAMTIPISPAVVPSGQYQNVTNAIADNSTITVHGSTGRAHRLGLAFHKDAFTLATADLEVPKGVHEAARVSDKQLGISLRMVTAYDIRTDQMITRLDVLYGWAVTRPELAVRVSS